jgi:hypothetical protein
MSNLQKNLQRLHASSYGPGGERSPYPPGRRDLSNTKKEAYEKAKRAGGGKEPIHHPGGEYGPHYHPNVKMPNEPTPKAPSPHDHYNYPKRRK